MFMSPLDRIAEIVLTSFGLLVSLFFMLVVLALITKPRETMGLVLGERMVALLLRLISPLAESLGGMPAVQSAVAGSERLTAGLGQLLDGLLGRRDASTFVRDPRPPGDGSETER